MRMGAVVGNAGIPGAMAFREWDHLHHCPFHLGPVHQHAGGRGGVLHHLPESRPRAWWCAGYPAVPVPSAVRHPLRLRAGRSLRLIYADLPVQFVAALIVIGVGLVAARSTVLALKMQLPIMLLMGFPRLVGHRLRRPAAFREWVNGGFWQVFAGCPLAVTGVLAGVGLSGDLRDPARSIPLGVLPAVVTVMKTSPPRGC